MVACYCGILKTLIKVNGLSEFQNQCLIRCGDLAVCLLKIRKKWVIYGNIQYSCIWVTQYRVESMCGNLLRSQIKLLCE